MPESGETAKLPATLPVAADFGFPYDNFGKLTLDGDHTNVATSIVALESIPAGWPQSGELTIDTEIITYTSWTTKTFSGLTRGAQGTSAASHSSGARIGRYITEKAFNQILAELLQIARFAARSAREDVTGATTVDFSDVTKPYNRFHRLTGNVNYTLSNVPTRGPVSIETEQDATGGRTFTFTTTIKWKGGSQPTPSTTAGKKAIWVFENDGTDILGDCAYDF